MKLDMRALKKAKRSTGLPCFSIVRNEAYFLPHFLRHYRALGIEHFIFYDDHSTDGSRELLMAEPDCTVVTSDYGFRETMPNGRPFHYVARTRIPEHFARGGWCLTVDADEFLLLPRRFAALENLIRHLETERELCAMGPMVDLYPATLAGRNYPDDRPPFEGVQWWFDRACPFNRIAGVANVQPLPVGVRIRLAAMLKRRHPKVFADIFNVTRAFIYSKLWKVPLLKTGRGIVRLDTHSVTVPAAPDVQLGLAHFRFYPRLDAKIADAIARQGYARGSQEYKFLGAVIELFEDEPLVCEQSVAFESAATLESVGLTF